MPIYKYRTTVMANQRNVTATTTTTADKKKADAWLNISINTSSGKKAIGGIPLDASKELHKLLIDALHENEENCNKAMGTMECYLTIPESEETQGNLSLTF